MISPKILELFLTLVKSSKAPFVRDDIKLLTSQEWAVIEKEVCSENGRMGNQGAVRSDANQMKEKTGVLPTLEVAASELGRRGNQGSVCSVANQMMRKLGCCQHWWRQHPSWAAGCTKAEHRLARFLEISEL